MFIMNKEYNALKKIQSITLTNQILQEENKNILHEQERLAYLYLDNPLIKESAIRNRSLYLNNLYQKNVNKITQNEKQILKLKNKYKIFNLNAGNDLCEKLEHLKEQINSENADLFLNKIINQLQLSVSKESFSKESFILLDQLNDCIQDYSDSIQVLYQDFINKFQEQLECEKQFERIDY